MGQQDWTSATDRQAQLSGAAKLVGTPSETADLGTALRGAFRCEKGSTADFDTLLAKLR
ncbi:hypothetical protein [uncultured Sphingomonas sp.]|uniref:hypothetical protein n=1 Tax=uncultured Sphingomonas sp. TaxID=158754 RepID=UPI0026178145|nr:hypothetical protein [uncultured Sphingomonas sp.]